ncbi:MAG: hypothetical protein LJF30_12800 [Acidobacteria bacterium]|jgi:hypothetical protein|nr:hypothetical protein [Acidobacteriota bacterium]
MANQVTHDHQCPECGRDEACASPECRALPRRLCPKCMDRAWRHARTNARRAHGGASGLEAA